MKTLSPLRYPGGKSKIYKKVKEIIEINFTYPPVYAEAFAGGAALALKLLIEGVVKEVHINDLDDSIYSFWYLLKNHKDILIEKINTTEITIDEWINQKRIYMNKESNVVDKGFATFFLNRTNRSGVLSAGPIGGKLQNGNYKIDCRFNKVVLIDLINLISQFSDRINIYNLEANAFISEIDNKFNNSIIYLDPPYVRQGPNLYLNHLDEQDHRLLGYHVSLLKNKWFITYDNNPLVHEIYQDYYSELFDINYSLARKRVEQEIFIYSDTIDRFDQF